MRYVLFVAIFSRAELFTDERAEKAEVEEWIMSGEIKSHSPRPAWPG